MLLCFLFFRYKTSHISCLVIWSCPVGEGVGRYTFAISCRFYAKLYDRVRERLESRCPRRVHADSIYPATFHLHLSVHFSLTDNQFSYHPDLTFDRMVNILRKQLGLYVNSYRSSRSTVLSACFYYDVNKSAYSTLWLSVAVQRTVIT